MSPCPFPTSITITPRHFYVFTCMCVQMYVSINVCVYDIVCISVCMCVYDYTIIYIHTYIM